MKVPLGLLVLLGLHLSAASEPPLTPSFPAPTPVAGAKPATRHKQIIQFPTRLVFDQKECAMTLGIDKEGTKPVEILVDSKMVVGTRERIFIYPWGQDRPKREHSSMYAGGCDLIALPTNSRPSINFMLGKEGGPVPGRLYVIEVVVEVFESDEPPPHALLPVGDNFKALYSGTLKAEKIVRP